MDDNTRKLYEHGRSDLEARFHPDVNLVHDPFLPHRHSPHHSLWHATYLLDAGDVSEASSIVEKVLTMQELRDSDPHFGNFRWHYEDGGVIDLNACQFVLEALCHMPLDRLPDALRERVFVATRLALAEAERLDVHWTYTNIYLHDVQNRILGGQIISQPDITRVGLERLIAWADKTREVGAPHEFNSPTYAAVQLNALANVVERAQDATAREVALEMEHLIWRHVAQYWHAPTMQAGGPHSRTYRRDVVGAPGFLKVVLYKLLGDPRLMAETPYYEGYAAEGHGIVARTTYHCPPDAEAMFHQPASRDVRETVALNPRTDVSAAVRPEFTLGTMSRPYGVGDPREPWPADNSCIAYWTRHDAPGYGVMYCRYRTNAGLVGEPSRAKVPSWYDIWEEGLFRTAQSGTHAIVAYGLAPRGQRPMSSLRLDIRVLGADRVSTNDGKWTGDLVPVYGEPIIIAAPGSLIGIIPLDPTDLGCGSGVTIWRDGPETVISITNYEGSPKQFWEYRSLSGPFFKGNVRSGFAVWIAPRSDFATLAEFRTALVETPLSDEVADTIRSIRFASAWLDYDLREMWP